MADRCTILIGDARERLAALPERSVRCCVTSPPYWGLRDYGCAGQIGLEPTPAEYVATMVAVFAEVRRVLTDDGTCWVNMGDSYNAYNGNRGASKGENKNHLDIMPRLPQGAGLTVPDMKAKDLLGMPWRLAFALQADGWYLRSDIIWSKPNPMPESVKDRPTKSHEYIFLLSKESRYYFDADSISEPSSPNTHMRISQDLAAQVGSFRANGGSKTNGPMRAVMKGTTRKIAEAGSGIAANRDYEAALAMPVETRNTRSVWTIPTQGYSGAHFATFPRELAARCIKAGSAVGDLVLDPFLGTGTTIAEAVLLGRRGIGIELNREYATLAEKRISELCPLLAGEVSR